MPVTTCTLKGSPGYRWGKTGKCYTYDPNDPKSKSKAKRKATAQGGAAYAAGYSVTFSTEDDMTMHKVRTDDAVEKPTRSQRSGLPAQAFEPAAYFMDDEGGFDWDGKFLVSKSKLPHHINTVKDPKDNGTVDVPRLRNALARFDQVDWSDLPRGTERKTRIHLERHADAVLKSRERENADCPQCSKEDLQGLAVDLQDFRLGNYSKIRERQGR